MTDYRDPNMRPGTDPLDPNPHTGSRMRGDRTGSMWGWIGGLALVAIILAVIFSMGGEGTRTANQGDQSPPATTGSTPPATNPPASAPAR
jgi:hypothetical protein